MIKTSSDNFQQPEKGKPDSLSFYFSSCEQQVIISAVFFFYEEQLLWVLDTFSRQCHTPAVASYLAHAQPRLEELALLPLGAQGRDQAQPRHLDRVMASLAATPLRLLPLLRRRASTIMPYFVLGWSDLGRPQARPAASMAADAAAMAA